MVINRGKQMRAIHSWSFPFEDDQFAQYVWGDSIIFTFRINIRFADLPFEHFHLSHFFCKPLGIHVHMSMPAFKFYTSTGNM